MLTMLTCCFGLWFVPNLKECKAFNSNLKILCAWAHFYDQFYRNVSKLVFQCGYQKNKFDSKDPSLQADMSKVQVKYQNFYSLEHDILNYVKLPLLELCYFCNPCFSL